MVVSTLALATVNADSILYLGSTEVVTYDTAQSRCESLGGQLATFGSVGEFEALQMVRDGLGGGLEAHGGNTWIGLDDRDTEGDWKFSMSFYLTYSIHVHMFVLYLQSTAMSPFGL